MTHDEIVRALRWLAKETEFTFAAENLNGAADLIESLQAEVDEMTAQREKGCEYCNSRFGIATHHINGQLLQAGTKKIAIYCPMCGKRLEVEP